VVVLDDTGALRASTTAHDRKVAGVVAGAGKYRPGIVLDAGRENGSVTIAMIGKTYCKVDANYGSVAIGDLLTTSPTKGYAMSVSADVASTGAVIGKAMSTLANGQGLIPILVTLR
jgi:hypothetical protein